MDRTVVGLHESRRKGGNGELFIQCTTENHADTLHYLRISGGRIDVLYDFPAHIGDGQLHGAELVFGSVAQQLQFGGAQVEERGTSDATVMPDDLSMCDASDNRSLTVHLLSCVIPTLFFLYSKFIRPLESPLLCFDSTN